MEDKGKVITIDIEDQKNKPQHKRIHYLLGSSISEEMHNKIDNLIDKDDNVLVILDSSHTKTMFLRN